MASTSQHAFWKIDRRGAVAVVEVNRPPLNLLSTTVQDQLADLASQLSAESAVRAVVLHGGAKAFAAGADVKEMNAMSVEQLRMRPEGFQHGFNQLAALPKPVIAVITGVALGGGCELALTADVRYVAKDAILGQPEVRLGMIPGCGGTQRLARLIGPARAKDLMFTGRRIDATEAYRIGLADAVLPREDVFDAALAWARDLAVGPAIAYAAIKTSVDRGLDQPLDDGLALERDQFAHVFATQDKDIGTTHFVTKARGPAPFTGH